MATKATIATIATTATEFTTARKVMYNGRDNYNCLNCHDSFDRNMDQDSHKGHHSYNGYNTPTILA